MPVDNRFIIPPTHSAPGNLSDGALLNIAQGETPDHEEFIPPGKSINPIQWGGQLILSFLGGSVAPVITTPAFPVETDCTLILQIVTPAAANTGLQFNITYSIGAAVFTKVVNLTQGAPKLIWLTARNIQVSATLTSGGLISINTTYNATVRVAVCPGTLKLRDFYAWDNGVVSGANSRGLYTVNAPIVGGVLGQAHVILEAATAPGTPMWLLLFDLPGNGVGPSGSSVPTIFGVSDTLENVGDSSSYVGLFSPEALRFSTGLWAALSSTPDIYTSVASGNHFRLDFLVGT